MNGDFSHLVKIQRPDAMVSGKAPAHRPPGAGDVPARLLLAACALSAVLISVTIAAAQTSPVPASNPQASAQVSPRASLEYASSWTSGPLSKARLLAGGLESGVYRVGVEIALEGGAHTYWRLPGDGGVPPLFDFSASSNLKSASVRYPAPERSGEPGVQVFGYGGEVIFPLSVTPLDPAKPVVLKLNLTYGACDKICVPGKASLTLRLEPGSKSAASLARIMDYEALVPKPLSAPGAPALKVTPLATGRPESGQGGKDDGVLKWRASVSPAGGTSADIFAEGPEGWYFDTRRLDDGTFEISLAERPSTVAKDAPVPPVKLTLTGEAGAFEHSLTLPSALR